MLYFESDHLGFRVGPKFDKELPETKTFTSQQKFKVRQTYHGTLQHITLESVRPLVLKLMSGNAKILKLCLVAILDFASGRNSLLRVTFYGHTSQNFEVCQTSCSYKVNEWECKII